MESITHRVIDLTNSNLNDRDGSEIRESKITEIKVLIGQHYAAARKSEWITVRPMTDLSEYKFVYNEEKMNNDYEIIRQMQAEVKEEEKTRTIAA